MPLVTKWPNGIITCELTLLGVILTTLFALLITARIPDLRSHKLYDPGISNGKILRGVTNLPKEAREEIGKRLSAVGAEVVKEFGN